MRIRLTFENWGPVLSGCVEIKPFTVFIGPNNTGKSYTSMFYYAFMRAMKRALLLVDVKFPKRFAAKALGLLRETRIESVEDLKEGLTEEWQELDSVIRNFLDELSTVLRTSLESLLREELEKVYATKLHRLVNVNADKATVVVDLSSGSSTFTCALHVNTGREVKTELSLNIDKEKLIENLMSKLIKTGRLYVHHVRYFRPMLMLIERFLIKSFSLHGEVHYLPASRAGILHGYRSIAKAIISIAPLAAIRGIELPAVPGPVADFLANLVEIAPEERGEAEVAEIIEKEVVEGRISLARESRESPPAIVYEQENLRVPLTGVSSMVAELAPLSLYLKYGVIRRGDTLIIEEPEAHLHPSKQAKLAEALVKLVNRAGLTLIVTTHSDVFLAKLSNLVSLSALPESDLEEMGYQRDATLDPSKVGVYHFKREGRGAVIEQVKVTEEGIPDDVFRDVVESLYEETMTIYYRLQRLRASRNEDAEDRQSEVENS